MNWFETQLIALDKLAGVYFSAQQDSSRDIVSLSEDIRIKRKRFIDAVQTLVGDVMKIKGITACAAYHEGLVLANSGQTAQIDALGALIQESIGVARRGAKLLSLGDIQQIVIVGTTHKVAMLSVGPIVLCISSPKDVNLAAALSQKR